MARDDWPIKFTVRNMSGLVANIHQFDRETLQDMQSHMVVSAGLVVRRIRELCAKDTLYMKQHARARMSPQNLAFDAGWFREDFIGQQDYKGKVIRSFYPVPVENGWHDRAGRFHAGKPSLPQALAQTQRYIVDGTSALIQLNMQRAAARGGRR